VKWGPPRRRPGERRLRIGRGLSLAFDWSVYDPADPEAYPKPYSKEWRRLGRWLLTRGRRRKMAGRPWPMGPSLTCTAFLCALDRFYKARYAA